MKFTTNVPTEYDLKAGPRDGPAFFPVETLGPEVVRAALRAIAEHLGPETVREVLGEADEPRDAVTIGDLYMEMPCPVCETQIAVRGSSDPDDPIDMEPASDGPLQGAIRAAGYDPDQMGAAEVIRLRHRQACDARAERDRLEEAWGVASYQLREWRETVKCMRGAAERALRRCRLGDAGMGDLVCVLEQNVAITDRLLSATPDDPRSPDARAAEAEIDRIAAEQQGPVEPMVPAAQLRKRIDYLEQKLSESESADAEHVTQLQEAKAQKESLELRCASEGRDILAFRTRRANAIAVEMALGNPDDIGVVLDRASVRRAVDWMLAWLGDSDAFDSVARVALQQARAWLKGGNSKEAMLAIAREISWSVYRCDPDKGPIVAERDGAETKGDK